MSGDNKLALYAVEIPVAGKPGVPQGTRYHACLMLAFETAHGPQPLEELHFLHSERGGIDSGVDLVLVGIIMNPPAVREGSKLLRYTCGDETTLREVWDRAIDAYIRLNELRIPFRHNAGEDTINCRTGLRAVIEHLGFAFSPVPNCEGEQTKGTLVRLADHLRC